MTKALERFEERLVALEDGVTRVSASEEIEVTPTLEPPGPSDAAIANGIAFAGRTLLVLGGAYLLRALTEGGVVAPLTGVGLALAYALLWLGVADRAGAKGRATSAAFHGAAAVLVAFPLLWETTTRFGLLSPGWGSICLGFVSAVAIGVAWRWKLRTFVWVTLLGATLTSLLLLATTKDLFSFSWLLIFLGVATLSLAYRSAWPIVHWVVAVAADVSVTLVGIGATIDPARAGELGPLAVQLALGTAYLTTIVYHVASRERRPGAFELFQSPVVIAIGYGWALRTAPAVYTAPLGALFLALALGFLFVSFRATRPDRTRHYYGLVGTLLLLLGGEALAPDLVFPFAAVTLAWLGSKRARPAFSVYAAVLVTAAGVSSGLVQQAAYAFAAPAGTLWPPVGRAGILAFAAVILAGSLAASPRPHGIPSVARTVTLAVTVAALGGLLVSFLAAPVAGTGEAVDPARLATLRTAVLALAAVGLAGLARLARLREASWLVYGILLASGIKLVVEDFQNGRATTLFVALALYGGALIVAPRLSRVDTPARTAS